MASKKTLERKFHKIDAILLTVVIIVAIALRLYQIDSPLTDWHSWRQADTAAVARNFAREEFNLFVPVYDDLSNIQSGEYNPKGYRMVEFPFYNALFAIPYKYLPLLPVEVYGRIVSIIFSIITLICIYYLSFHEKGRIASVGASLTFAAFPFFVYYSRAVLPEMTAIGLMFSSVTALYWVFQKNRGRSSSILVGLLSIVLGALAILVKPTVAFYLLISLFIFFRAYRWSIPKKFQIYIYYILMLVPLMMWRTWILNFPEGIPVYGKLIISVNTASGVVPIFFRPAFFRWVFFERIFGLILGGFMVVPAAIGAISKVSKHLFFTICMTSAFIYLFVFQGGNTQHDYYQVIILPALAMLVGAGIAVIFEEKTVFTNRFVSVAAVVLMFSFSWMVSWYQVQDYYDANPSLVNIASVVRTVTMPDDLIVTDTTGDTTLLYLSDRKGYPSVTKPFGELGADGLAYIVTSNPQAIEELTASHEAVFESDMVHIFEL